MVLFAFWPSSAKADIVSMKNVAPFLLTAVTLIVITEKPVLLVLLTAELVL